MHTKYQSVMNTSASLPFSREVGVSGDATDRMGMEEGKGRKGSDTFLLLPSLFSFFSVK